MVEGVSLVQEFAASQQSEFAARHIAGLFPGWSLESAFLEFPGDADAAYLRSSL